MALATTASRGDPLHALKALGLVPTSITMSAPSPRGRFYVARWMAGAAALGLAIQLFAWWLAIRDGGAMTFAELHDRHPIMWLIDVLPSLLGFAGLAIGLLHVRLTSLRARVEDLAREIASGWTSELHTANLQLAESLEVRQRFFTSVSHEMRTPLTSIVGYSELAEALAVSPPEVTAYLSEIYGSARALLEIVNDLLDAAKMELGGITIDVVDTDPVAVADEVVRRLSPLARQKGLDLAVDAGGSRAVRADRNRLRQVLTNLVSNAVKYSEEGTIVVRVGDASDAGWIDVEDQGSGIAAEDLGRIFVPFVQADRDRGRVDSTGLGLSIARALVEAMDGTLEVFSDGPGTGSRFRIRLLPADGTSATRTASMSVA